MILKNTTDIIFVWAGTGILASRRADFLFLKDSFAWCSVEDAPGLPVSFNYFLAQSILYGVERDRGMLAPWLCTIPASHQSVTMSPIPRAAGDTGGFAAIWVFR